MDGIKKWIILLFVLVIIAVVVTVYTKQKSDSLHDELSCNEDD